MVQPETAQREQRVRVRLQQPVQEEGLVQEGRGVVLLRQGQVLQLDVLQHVFDLIDNICASVFLLRQLRKILLNELPLNLLPLFLGYLHNQSG